MKNFTIFNSKILVLFIGFICCIELGHNLEGFLKYAIFILPLYYTYSWAIHSIFDEIDYNINIDNYALKLSAALLVFITVPFFEINITFTAILLVCQILLVILAMTYVRKTRKEIY